VLRSSITQVLCLYCALTVGSVSANTIYSNLADGSGGNDTIRTSTDFTWASEFLTPSGSTLTLNDVIIELGEASGETNNITAFLYSNTGTTPNASLATIATVPHSSISLTPSQVTFTPGSTITLQASTEYWIVLSGTSVGANDAEWQLGTTNAGTGVAGQNHDQFNGASWATFANNTFTNTIPEMQVDATAPVPEPATFTLMGAALAGLAIVIRRRTRQ
jgi:PEP-CTERM motif